MLARKVQNALEISCFFCPTMIRLETCSESKCDTRHFLSEGWVVLKRIDDKVDWEKFLAGTLIKLGVNYQLKCFLPRIVPAAEVAPRVTCLDKRVPLPLIPNFGLGDKFYFWLCENCSFKDLSNDERENKFISTFEDKYNIWKRYFGEIQPKFLKKCAIEKRKATIADKKVKMASSQTKRQATIASKRRLR